MNFEDIIWLFNSDPKIPGTRNIIRMDLPEGAMLWKCVKRTKGKVLEIGRNLGGSTTLLLAATADEGREVASIDLSPNIPGGWERQWAMTAKVFEENKDRVDLIIGNSRTYRVPGPLGMLFIDGDHTYEGVKADILQHWSELEVGGLAVFHDAAEKSVPRKAIDETLISTGKGVITDAVWSVLVVKKLV